MKMKYINNLNRGKFLRETMESRFKILLGIVFFVMLIIIFRLIILTTYNQKFYKRYIQNATVQEVALTNAPRGRIYDRNGKLLVDNVMVKTIYYHKPDGAKLKDELKAAANLLKIADVPYKNLSENELIKYYILLNPQKVEALLTKKEQELIKERKISKQKANEMITERIKNKKLVNFNETEKKTLYVYKLMNNGYSYEEKIIKNIDVTDSEYLKVLEYQDLLGGISAKLEPTRFYVYGDTFRTMFGKVSSQKTGIPLALKDYYVANDYKLNDQVGITNIELQYENVLRGIKPIIKIADDNTYQVVKKGKRGNDIRLTIDMELQQYVEEVLIREITSAKAEPNTDYYNRSFVIVTDPKTGEILAMAGKQIKEDGSIVDFTPGIVTQPVTAGSIVKGASSIVGYNNGAIDMDKKILDECILLKATPKKCSWKSLGMVNDIEALALSSNSFQFKTAMRVAGVNYRANMPLVFKTNPFSLYRNTYAEFGLGVRTNINFTTESLGNRGLDNTNGQILDFAIGQYDTYTPLQITSYINTLANRGKRMKLTLLKGVYEPSINHDLNYLVYQNEPELLNIVNTKPEYMDRVLMGLKGVMDYGTGQNYMGLAPNPAGKTGTSQSFIDTNDDGKVDKQTISSTFGGFAPFENPEMAIVVVSPDVKSNTAIDFKSGVNKRIASQISSYFFTKP